MKKLLSIVTAALMCGGMVLPCTAQAETAVTTDTFEYIASEGRGGFRLKSDIADPDFMVVGIQENKDGLYGYWLEAINLTSPLALPDGDFGILQVSVAEQAFGDRTFRVGDLICVPDDYLCAAIYPTYFIFEEGSGEYLGNGMELFGEDFGQVIRNEMLVTGDTDASGDVSVLDCVALGRHLHGTLPLNRHAKLASDINTDGSVDVFDLGLLQQMLLNG